jgi:Tfp pilus assembly protein PilW
MLTAIRHAVGTMRHDERGATLIELLVSILTGLIVIGALFAILEVSLNQTGRLTDRVQANQVGRITMTRMIDELHSTCISPEFRPIQAESNKNELRFINAYSKEALIPTSEVTEHRILWNAAAGTLTDITYLATGGSWPKYTFSTTASQKVLISNHIAETEEKGTKLPVFQYFTFATTSEDSGLTPLSTIETKKPLKETLSETEAEQAASVLIRFTALPSDGSTALSRGIEMHDQVTLAMSAPSSETPIEASPCE